MVKENCNLWRIAADIEDEWASVNYYLDYMAKNVHQLKQTAGPGGWVDPDMVSVFQLLQVVLSFK